MKKLTNKEIEKWFKSRFAKSKQWHDADYCTLGDRVEEIKVNGKEYKNE